MRQELESLLEALVVMLARWRGTRRDAIGLAHNAWREITIEHWRKAIYYGKIAVAADPSYSHGWRVLGLAYLRAGDPDSARKTYERGILRSPTDPTLAVALGDLERELERFAEAEGWYRRALELEPENPESLWALGQSLRAQGRPEEAEKVFGEALTVAPNDPRVLQSLGEVRVMLRKYQEALPLLAEVVRREPTAAYVHYCLALALDATGNPQAALGEAQRAIEVEPKDSWYQALYQKLLHVAESPDPGDEPQ